MEYKGWVWNRYSVFKRKEKNLPRQLYPGEALIQTENRVEQWFFSFFLCAMTCMEEGMAFTQQYNFLGTPRFLAKAQEKKNSCGYMQFLEHWSLRKHTEK